MSAAEMEAQLEARNRAGRAVRDISHALVGHQAEVPLINEVANTLRALVDRLEQAPARVRDPLSFPSWEGTPAHGEPINTFADRPVSGTASPYGMDLVSFRDGDEAVARFTLRPAHEGAPGRSHGGIVSAIFDDVLGFVLQIHEIPGFTGELTVRYEAGTPIGRELEMRARLDRQEGRKLFMSAELHDGDTRVASARATFIQRDFLG
jgi:acyl-coenzyme A thioesterase PaaI-like protein